MIRRVFENGEYYHIYNRGVDKRIIFEDKDDYHRFLESLKEFNTLSAIGSLHENRFNLGVKPPSESSKIVEVVAYCLNPNHYHLLLKQIEENGIPKYLQKIGTGYTMYFNEKYKRSGSLFQGRYKSVHVESNEQILYLSSYINKNFYIHGYTSKKEEAEHKSDNVWEFSSELDYLGKRKEGLCNSKIILGQFKNVSHYSKFMEETALLAKAKKEDEMLILESLGG